MPRGQKLGLTGHSLPLAAVVGERPRSVVTSTPGALDLIRGKRQLRVGTGWRMDETYIRVRGEWMYEYRAVD